MPTRAALASFFADYDKLTAEQKRQFRTALALFIGWLAVGGEPPRTLRVKKMAGHKDIWEMSWAGDGRATFEYGPEQLPGQKHIVWRRIGTHDIFDRP